MNNMAIENWWKRARKLRQAMEQKFSEMKAGVADVGRAAEVLERLRKGWATELEVLTDQATTEDCHQEINKLKEIYASTTIERMCFHVL
jgi:hypothetical protein